MPSIVTLTLNPSLDLACDVDRVMPEEKLRCTEPTAQPGGGGLNVARAIARLGGESTAVWASGGANGRRIGEMLEAEGVHSLPVPIAAETRQNLSVFERASTLQYRFGFPGAKLTDDELDACIDALRKLGEPDYLVLSGSLPPGVDPTFYKRVTLAVERARVVIDTSGEALKQAVRGRAWMLKPNLRELSDLVGEEVLDDRDIVRTSRQLIENGNAEVIVTTLGAAGALLVTSDLVDTIRSPTVPIRSKVGAGDSTVAGMVVGLSRGMSLQHAVRLGVAAGASAVSTPGTDLCRRDQTERLHQMLLASDLQGHDG